MKVLTIGSDRALFDQGSEVALRARKYAERFGELHVVVFTLRARGYKEVHTEHLHVYPTNSYSRLLYVFDAARLARRLQGDVITVQDPFESGLAGIFACKGRPLHVQLHTDMFVPGFARGQNRLRLLVAPFVFSRAVGIRTLTESIKENIKKRYKPHAHIAVLPIFVDTEKLRALAHTPHPRFVQTLLWVGRFEKEKNPALAIEALKVLRQGKKEVGLVMLGSGSLGEHLHKLARELGVEEWVEFPGWQDPLPYYAMADLLLVTSIFEGYGRQIIEALAAGVPVLATDVGIAREAGATIAPEESFAKALATWAESGPRTAELKNYPYKTFEEYVEKYCADITATARL